MELRVPVGPGTEIPLVGVARSNPVYKVLLCQTFHKLTGGWINPIMGRFVYHPHLWDRNDVSTVGTLEGMQGPDWVALPQANVTNLPPGRRRTSLPEPNNRPQKTHGLYRDVQATQE